MTKKVENSVIEKPISIEVGVNNRKIKIVKSIKWFLKIIAFILLLVFLINIIFKLNILINGDVLISIDPSNQNILTQKRTSENVSYLISFENRMFCEATCSYTFVDLSNNKIVDQKNFTTKDNNSMKIDFLISPPEKGTGQLAFELNSKCVNKKSFLCKSDETERQKSSFLTLSYELSIEERDSIENLNGLLVQSLNDVINQDLMLQDLTYQYEMLNSSLHLMDFNLQSFTDDFFLLKNDIIVAKNLWNNEEYNRLNESLVDIDYQLRVLNYLLLNASNFLKRHVYSYENTRKNIVDFTGEFEKYEDLIFMNQLLKQNTRNYLSDYYKIVKSFNNNNYQNYFELDDEVENLTTDLLIQYEDADRKIIVLNEYGQSLLNEYNLTLVEQNDSLYTLNAICLKIDGIDNLSDRGVDFSAGYCGYNAVSINFSNYDFNLISLPDVDDQTFLTDINISLKEHLPVCCIFDECDVCLQSGENKNNEEMFPIILVHGHAFSDSASIENSLAGFSTIRTGLVSDGFIDGGTVLNTDLIFGYEEGVLGKYNKPIVFGTTYYVDESMIKSTNDDIETYASRLDKVIDIVKFKSGSSKVNIIAHSMGGLVVRKYLVDFGDDDVDKLIMIGTPNKGIERQVESFCPIAGAQKECSQMSSTSKFINELNNANNKPKNTKSYVIFGEGCNSNRGDGDGVVFVNNTKLPYSLNFGISGDCDNSILHSDLLNINKYPEVYQIITNIIQN